MPNEMFTEKEGLFPELRIHYLVEYAKEWVKTLNLPIESIILSARNTEPVKRFINRRKGNVVLPFYGIVISLNLPPDMIQAAEIMLNQKHDQVFEDRFPMTVYDITPPKEWLKQWSVTLVSSEVWRDRETPWPAPWLERPHVVLYTKAEKKSSQHVFIKDKDNETWTIEFAGKRVEGVKSWMGMDYIHFLLMHPGKAFSAAEIEASVRPQKENCVEDSGKEFKDISGDELEKKRMRIKDSLKTTSDSLKIDDQAKRAYRRELDKIDAEIAEAKIKGDPAIMTNELMQDRQRLLNELISKSKISDVKKKSAQDRVRKSVSDTIAGLNDYHHKMAFHLSRYLHTGAPKAENGRLGTFRCIYNPPPKFRPWNQE